MTRIGLRPALATNDGPGSGPARGHLRRAMVMVRLGVGRRAPGKNQFSATASVLGAGDSGSSASHFPAQGREVNGHFRAKRSTNVLRLMPSSAAFSVHAEESIFTPCVKVKPLHKV